MTDGRDRVGEGDGEEGEEAADRRPEAPGYTRHNHICRQMHGARQEGARRQRQTEQQMDKKKKEKERRKERKKTSRTCTANFY